MLPLVAAMVSKMMNTAKSYKSKRKRMIGEKKQIKQWHDKAIANSDIGINHIKDG